MIGYILKRTKAKVYNNTVNWTKTYLIALGEVYFITNSCSSWFWEAGEVVTVIACCLHINLLHVCWKNSRNTIFFCRNRSTISVFLQAVVLQRLPLVGSCIFLEIIVYPRVNIEVPLFLQDGASSRKLIWPSETAFHNYANFLYQPGKTGSGCLYLIYSEVQKIKLKFIFLFSWIE